MTASTRYVLIAMTVGMTLMTVGGVAYFVDLDSDGLLGAGIGAALGLLNLAVGYRMTSRAVTLGLNPALRILVGGFLLRLVVLAGLMIWFHSIPTIDEVAFALVFMLFFFVLVAIEIVTVEKHLQGNGRHA
jgi:hypothetical protein